MITETIVKVMINIAAFIIGLLPDWACTLVDGSAGLGTILAYGLYFFPSDVWITGIAMGGLMMGTSMTYALLEWVWKKIPGVD